MSLPSRVCHYVVSRLQRLRTTAPDIRHALGKYYCPVCARRVAKFDPLPQFYQDQWAAHGYIPPAERDETCNFPSYSCPFCMASDRDRLYALYLSERLPRNASTFRFIDFAPSRALRPYIKRNHAIAYRTADLFDPDVDDRADLRNLTCYASGSIDAFLCSHVLEHIPEDTQAMMELFRILKPGGWGITMVPIPLGFEGIREDPTISGEADRWKHFGQGDHVRVYSRRAFISRLESVGFLVRSLDHHHFGRDTFQRHGLAATSVLYVVEKPVGNPR